MATLFHPYNPNVRPGDQLQTWDVLTLAEWPKGLNIVHWRCTFDLDYAEGLAEVWWDRGDLVIWEQDIVASPDHVKELMKCGRMVCAYDYPLGNGVPWSTVPGATGLGLWKATGAARRSVEATPAVPRAHWRDLGGQLSERVGMPHVHTPMVLHNHREEA